MCSRQAYCSSRGQRHHFKRKFKKMMARKMAHGWQGNSPLVNVQEYDDRYELLVYAAGYAKEDFQVNIKDNSLIISAKNENTETAGANWKHQEFRRLGFERQFELNDKIDKDSIIAKYEDGILKLTLLKLEGFETIRKEVEIN